MPYETFTNDSDSQFAAQIDRYKLGPGVSPGGDMFSASEAMLAQLGNNPMNVARLMQARATLHSNSMDTRRTISSDRMLKQDSDEFDAYSKMMESGVTGDPLEDAKLRQKAAIQFGDHERVNRHLSAFAAADAGVIQGRKALAENRQLDYEDSTWKEREDLDRQMLSQTKQRYDLEGTRQKDLMDANEDNVAGLLNSSAGAILDKNGALSSAIMKTGYHFTLGASKDLEMAKAIGKTASLMAQTYGLESVYADRYKKSALSMAAISQKVGINADDIDDPKRYDQFLVKAKFAIENGPENEKENSLAALENHALLKGVFLQRSALEKDFISHLDKRPANLSSPEGEEWKAGVVALRGKAEFIGGHIGKKQEELNTQLSKQDAYMDSSLKLQKMQKNDADMKHANSQEMLRNEVHTWNKYKFEESKKLRLLQMAMPKGSKEEVGVRLAELEAELDDMETKQSSGEGSLID